MRKKIRVSKRSRIIYHLTIPMQRHPFLTFLLSLLLLFLVIFSVNVLLKSKVSEETPKQSAKEVEVYKIGRVPKITLQGQVEKTNVVKVSALAGGVVQAINFLEGSEVSQGQTLIVLSSNYQGGNAPAITRQIAQAQLNNVNSTFDLQKEVIKKQKEIAEKSSENADKLREIANQAISETNAVIDLNSSILNTLDENLKNLEDNSGSDDNDSLILQTKQLKSQFQSANAQLRNALRNAELQASSDKPPAQLATLQKDITLKQLEIQEKGLNLSREVASLQLSLAFVQEATMYPAAPFGGRIERIHVRVGQQVAPGMPLVTLSGFSASSNLYVKVSQEIASSVSKLEPSVIHLKDKDLLMYPDFISSEATDGQLYVIHFYLPDGTSLTDNGFVSVEIPIGYPDTSSAIPFVPVDSVFQGQESSYLFVVDKDKASEREVKLGQVLGRFVEVVSGLRNGDQIILNRNVVSGDQVKAI